jgi:hypothetical protein
VSLYSLECPTVPRSSLEGFHGFPWLRYGFSMESVGSKMGRKVMEEKIIKEFALVIFLLHENG